MKTSSGHSRLWCGSDDAGDGGEGGVIHHREHHPVIVLLPDDSLDSLLNVQIDQLSFIISRHEHITELSLSLVSLPSFSADPDKP